MNKQTFNNPYEVLEVSPAASAAEITKAYGLATKKRQYPIDVIAKARKALMNPQDRLIADFLRPCLPPVQRLKRGDYSLLEQPAPTIEFRQEFYKLGSVIEAAQPGGNIDKQLGSQVFLNSPIETPSIERSAIDAPNYLSLPTKPTLEAFVGSSEGASIADSASVAKDIAIGMVQELVNTKKLLNPKFLIWFTAAALILLGGGIAFRVLRPAQQTAQSRRPSVPVNTGTTSNEQAQSSNISSTTAPIGSYSERYSESRSNDSPESTPISRDTNRSDTESDTTATPELSSEPQSLDSCGDQSSSSDDWYPVYIPNSPENLRYVRYYYCRDAIPRYRIDKGVKSIQVASFTSRDRAAEFAQQLRTNFSLVEIGVPDTRLDPQITPMYQCGSSHSPRSKEYWYPVLIDYSERNLRIVRAQYCKDAFRKRLEDGRFRIQVASFQHPQEAANFAGRLQQTFSSSHVGGAYQLP
jgi:hypothetical protein